jgi:hypothetical protein
MNAFLKRHFFATIAKKKAGANVFFKSSEDNINQLGTTVIDMEEATNNINCLSNTSEIQNLIDHMSHESCEIHVIKNIRKLNVPDTIHTTGSVLEVSVAITVSSEVNNKPILLNQVLIDTGCTRSIIKRNSLPDQFFETEKQFNAVSWTTNAGKFVTKYNIPLQFSLPEFAPSREIYWSVAVDGAVQQSNYDIIIGRNLQIALC